MKEWIALRQMLIVCLLLACACTHSRKSFDSKAWLTGDLRLRGQMALDLEKSKLLIGKTRAEVEALLGKSACEGAGYWCCKVDIGHRFGSSVWPYNFNVIFDEATRAVIRTSLTD
jgi:hypothetical protein